MLSQKGILPLAFAADAAEPTGETYGSASG